MAGKTGIVRRFVEDGFDRDYQSSIPRAISKGTLEQVDARIDSALRSSCGMKRDYPLKEFKTPRSFETWLSRNHATADGIRIKIGKKGSAIRSIRYAEALAVALCYGWIDSQSKSIDEWWYWQRFTPRRARSMWSKRNRDIVLRLIEEGRMQPAGQAEIDRARSDGRWDAAYDSPANATVPTDLTAALRKSPRAKRFFESLDAQNRYAILQRLMTARKPETRAKRLATLVEMLREGLKLYP